MHEFIEAVELDSGVVHHAADDRLQPQLSPSDHTRQSETTDRGCIEVGIFGWRAQHVRTVGSHQLKLRHVVAEGSGNVVVLPVNVIGDRAAKGYILGSRSNGKKESARHGKV